jgi:CheY-like chemotaxis protein
MTDSKQKPARVLIVDDHAIVRYGMGVLLSGANDLTLCGEAGTYDEALAAIHELKPDIAVIDLILYDRSGLDLIRQIRAEEAGGQRTEGRGQMTEVKSQETFSQTPSLPHFPAPSPSSSCPCTTNPLMPKKHCGQALKATL